MNTDVRSLTLADLARIPTISVVEAGRVLGLGRGSSYEAARRGEIPVIRIGARLRVPSARLLELLHGLEAKGLREEGS